LPLQKTQLMYNQIMKWMKTLWNNFTHQPDIWFFYGFLFTFTLSARKVLFFYPLVGKFNEYSGIYLYLSDLFLFLTILCWIISLLCNKNNYLSIYNAPSKNRCSTWNIIFKKAKDKLIYILPALLVIFSFISIFWSENRYVSLFRSIKILEFYLLFLYIVLNVPRGTFLKRMFQIIIFLGVFNSILGIWQFIFQHSIGLYWLKESIISPELPGVAKIIFDNERFIRIYGFFPHPNILGGFLLLSIGLTVIYRTIFLEQITFPVNNKCSMWNICDRYKRIFLYFILFIQLCALFLTFSKSSWIAVLIILTCILCLNVPRGTLAKYLRKSSKYIFFSSTILILLIIIIKPDINSFIIKSSDERMFYFSNSFGYISFLDFTNNYTLSSLSNILLGTGSGQSVLFLQNIPNILDWQFQPVHNVFFLILNELGLIGFLLFLVFIIKVLKLAIKNNKCSMWNIFRNNEVIDGTLILHQLLSTILISYIFIMTVDHYFWDIQQGQILLWIVMGILIGINVSRETLRSIE